MSFSELMQLKTEKTNKKFMVLSAIGIIMVVDAHSWASLNLFTEHFPYNSFFMPMFVFISGYFNRVDESTNLLDYLKRKIKKLMLPFLGISLLVWMIECFINSFRYGVFVFPLFSYVKGAMLRLITSGNMVLLAEPMWFVPALFLVELIYAAVKKTLLKLKLWSDLLALGCFCILNVLTVCMGKNDLATPGNILLLKCGFFIPFLQMGVLYRRKGEEFHKRINPWVLLTLLILINMFRILMMPDGCTLVFNNLMIMGGFTGPHYYTPLISSVLGILFWLTLVDVFGKAVYESRLVNYISNNTFWIMGCHLAMINLLNCLLLFIHCKLYPLNGFDIELCIQDWWYRWDVYPAFRMAYFVVGIVGALITKLLSDDLKNRIQVLVEKRKIS